MAFALLFLTYLLEWKMGETIIIHLLRRKQNRRWAWRQRQSLPLNPFARCTSPLSSRADSWRDGGGLQSGERSPSPSIQRQHFSVSPRKPSLEKQRARFPTFPPSSRPLLVNQLMCVVHRNAVSVGDFCMLSGCARPRPPRPGQRLVKSSVGA